MGNTNHTIINSVRIQESLGDELWSTASGWSFILLISLFTAIFIIILTCFFVNSESSQYLSRSLTVGSTYLCPETNKSQVVCPYAVVTIKNGRPYQEDRYCVNGSFNGWNEQTESLPGNDDVTLYAVFDGHGGAKCSQFCAVNLGSSIEKAINTSPYQDAAPNRSRSGKGRKGERKSTSGFLREMDVVNGFQLCDAKYKGTATRDDGSTVVSVFINKAKKQIITAHVGDSRAVMITDHSSFDLTIDHKPSNPSEKERVELQGGQIVQYGVLRVQGVLAVTRSLGDYSLRPYVSNTPTVNYYDLTGDECFVVIASDGLWDVLDHHDVAQMLERCIHDGMTLQQCANRLVQQAVELRSADNITVMIVDMRKEGSPFGKEVTMEAEKGAGEKEESMQRFDDLLKESIHVLESTIGEIEKN